MTEILNQITAVRSRPVINTLVHADVEQVLAQPLDERQAQHVATELAGRNRRASHEGAAPHNHPRLAEPQGMPLPASEQLALLQSVARDDDAGLPLALLDGLNGMRALLLRAQGQSLAGPLSGIEASQLIRERADGLMATLTGAGRIALPTLSELQAAKGLLDDAPAMNNAVDALIAMPEEQRRFGFETDPRYTFLLALIAMLMGLVASQRELSAAMIQYAETSVINMGERMVGAAEEGRTGAWVGLGVGVALATTGVVVGGLGAFKAVSSIRHNEGLANTKMATADNLKLAADKGSAMAASNGSASQPRHDIVRATPTQLRQESAVLRAEHAVQSNQAMLITQAGHGVGSIAQGASGVATAEYQVRSAEQTRQQELNRQNALSAQRTSETAGQEAKKNEEDSQGTMQKIKEQEQARIETADAIAGKL